MLADKYTTEYLAPFVTRADRWFDVLRAGTELSGFQRCLKGRSTQLKLSEIYLAKSFRGKGLGRLHINYPIRKSSKYTCRPNLRASGLRRQGLVRLRYRIRIRICNRRLSDGEISTSTIAKVNVTQLELYRVTHSSLLVLTWMYKPLIGSLLAGFHYEAMGTHSELVCDYSTNTHCSDGLICLVNDFD